MSVSKPLYLFKIIMFAAVIITQATWTSYMVAVNRFQGLFFFFFFFFFLFPLFQVQNKTQQTNKNNNKKTL